MSGLTFTQRTDMAGRARSADAMLPGGYLVRVDASVRADRVELALSGDVGYCCIAFTAAQARSVAAELLACADARDTAQGRA